jgi:hypothetical protein
MVSSSLAVPILGFWGILYVTAWDPQHAAFLGAYFYASADGTLMSFVWGGALIGSHIGVATTAAIGPMIAGAWSILLLSRRWRPEPGWIDRMGTIIGACWIVEWLLLYGRMVLLI